MPEYKLIPIADTTATDNSDVFRNNTDYMGRLFLFPSSNPALNTIGITQEWFFVRSTGEVVSGHVNADGEWCISPPLSLAPSQEFGSVEQVLEQVFNTSASQYSSATPMTSEFVQISNQPSDSNDTDNNGSGLERTNCNAEFDAITWANSISNLDILRELLADEFTTNEEVIIDGLADEALPEDEHQVRSHPTNEQQIKLDERERLQLQDSLVEKVLEVYQTEATTEFLLPPLGEVTVHVEEEYFVLLAADDGHTMLAATLAGEVLKELTNMDAVSFAELWQQSLVESAKLETIEATDERILHPSFNENKGIEYGD